MSLFGQFVRTVVNVAAVPVAIVRDVVTLGGAIDNNGTPHTADAIDKLKREAESGDRDHG